MKKQSSNNSSSILSSGIKQVTPSPRNLPGVPKSKIEVEADASNLVGRIVEKGFSSTPSGNSLKPSSLPRPTVLPFPVARHRSHGPHWNPVTNEKNDEEDDENEDKDDTDFDPIAAFANPIEKKPKKGLDFSRWRELVQEGDGSSVPQVKKTDNLAMADDGRQKGEEESENAKKGNGLYSSVAFASKEVNGLSRKSSNEGRIKSGEIETDVTSRQSSKLDNSDSFGSIKANGEADKGPSETRAENGEVKADDYSVKVPGNVEKDASGSLAVAEHAKDEGTHCQDLKFDRVDAGEGYASLESQIDAENRARLQQMSAEEIAEAQAEIVAKMKPGLLEVLKRRGQEKLEQQKRPTPDLATSHHLGTQRDKSDPAQTPSSAPPTEATKSSGVALAKAIPTKDTAKRSDDGGLQTLVAPGNSLWNAWNERVEAVRALRFCLDGTTVEGDSVKGPTTGNVPEHSQYNVDNVTERDFLRTEGDPGAVGYTIKEAVALTRSMVPGQRALALQLLGSVFDKALCNIQLSEVGDNMKSPNNNRKVDWKAVWAFSLGPEPELVLALRMALDDNHISVVLACAKVIQCILSCEMNENFFDISEKLAEYEDIYTAPVFRSRPEINVGFLRGGFWKYNTKPSNIFPLVHEVRNDENEGEHTIQDDIVVAGQDFAAGLVRMGILPRIRHLLETDPSAALEECLISILVQIARHSPTCANAIMKCERLVQTVVDRFIKKDTVEIHPSEIKSVTLLKVLSQSDKRNCIHFIKNGIFRNTMWHLYRYELSIDQWIKSGQEHCRLLSALMVEQLRFWKVCIQYSYCVSYFRDFFPALSLWLCPPMFDKLIENNVLSEFASITREAYLVLDALARRLPYLHYGEELKKQTLDSADEDIETWSWSYAGAMVELALKWISLKSNPFISKILDWHRGTTTYFAVQDSSLSCLLWVISAVMHMLSSVVNRVAPENTDSLGKSGGRVPWLPKFVPKIGLEIVNNRFLNFSSSDTEYVEAPNGKGSFVENLCHLRHDGDNELLLSATCCLKGLVQLIVSIDKFIQVAKNENINPSSQGCSISREGKILEDGMVMWCREELRSLLITFMKSVDSGWQYVQFIEVFGRAGPAPGVGLGWGASGGGFWSITVLLAQMDACLLVHLLEIFKMVVEKEITEVEDMTFNLQKINSILGVFLILGPRNKIIMEQALDILLRAPTLKYLDYCVNQFLHLANGIKSFTWKYKEEDYLYFSKILSSHFKERWLSVKKPKNSSDVHKLHKKVNGVLETIHEDSDITYGTDNHPFCTSLIVEWVHQRLPLPMHWFLSPISTICDSKAALELPNAFNKQNDTSSPSDEVVAVAKSGLFFLLSLEAMSSFLCNNVQQSPVWAIPLVWKLHSLSMVLLVKMDVIEEERSRDIYNTLQELYGKMLDESRGSRDIPLMEKECLVSDSTKNCKVEFLKFQSEVHESYPTFIETFIEQFAAVSYGDVIYGRQVTMYLHRTVEVPVRLATWNALSNAHILELLPPLEKCFAEAAGYLEPTEDNEQILEAYMKSWISGALDRAATRRSVTFILALHHLSSFIFLHCTDGKILLRNKLVKSLLRDYSRKQQHEGMILDFIRYREATTNREPVSKDGSLPQTSEMERRFQLLTEACEGNSSLLVEVEKLKSSSRRL
ncbi:PREDICTED: transcriptional elongation regulator MINIYO [Nelumbo nucifera]|uniref:Transcriptional elongation regulator MINIYO n=2 Tax=Nelumbo nucifera TaxID=4432 RepID=A0A1U8B7S2_NELNU|nr:PREDICTED: transcriptional elongation regulator MINIYO [Nelumbo nucifera]DAD43822.1 TPA_asm: hypothetical protein HUJ06_002052 [Nelumbo nucifera]